jgi:hypothetical protein
VSRPQLLAGNDAPRMPITHTGKVILASLSTRLRQMSDYPPDQKLWRYMSFSRFMWLLQRKLLWIGRSDTLNDPWELAINPTYLAETLARAPITPIGEERRRL